MDSQHLNNTDKRVQPLRILAVSRAYGQHAGGMERLSFELLRALDSEPQVKLHKITRLDTSRFGAIVFAVTSIPRVLWHARDADLVHLGDPVLSLSGWLVKKLLHKPVAVTIHGLDITYNHRFYQLYLRLFFRKFHLYLPISSHAAQLLEQHRPSGQIQVINPGVTDNQYDPTITRAQWSQHEELQSLQLHTNKVALCTVGRLVPRKGHAWFISSVLAQLPGNVVYVIAGDGPEREHLHEAAQQHGLTDRVIILGRISDQALRVLYNTVDAFIQPNVPVANDAEGFGLVLLEAALCNRPIFAARLEGITDAIRHGKNGTLLSPQDNTAWQTALTTFCRTPHTAPAARTYTLEHFKWSHVARRYTTLFHEVAAR